MIPHTINFYKCCAALGVHLLTLAKYRTIETFTVERLILTSILFSLCFITENQHNRNRFFLMRLVITSVNLTKRRCIEVMSPRIVVEAAIENGE